MYVCGYACIYLKKTHTDKKMRVRDVGVKMSEGINVFGKEESSLLRSI